MPRRVAKKATVKRKKVRTAKSKNVKARKKLAVGKAKTKRSAVKKKVSVASKKKKSTSKRRPAKKTVKKRAAAKRALRKRVAAKKTVKKRTVTKKVVKKKASKKKLVVKKTAAAKKKRLLRKRSAVVVARTKRKIKKKLIKAPRKIGRIKLAADYRPSGREKYMCAEQLVYFSRRLLEWKEVLMRGVDKTVDNLKHEVNNYADSMDRATHEEEFDLELRTRDRERKLIRKINRALALIDNKKYGYCTECSARIGLKRIEARPTATLCIDCKTTQEFHEKQIAEDL